MKRLAKDPTRAVAMPRTNYGKPEVLLRIGCDYFTATPDEARELANALQESARTADANHQRTMTDDQQTNPDLTWENNTCDGCDRHRIDTARNVVHAARQVHFGGKSRGGGSPTVSPP